MLDKVLASVRIGAAEVDTRLDRDAFLPGEEFTAQVVVEGGNADQRIEGLELRLEVELSEDRGGSGRNEVIDHWHVQDGFTIEEGERRVFDFEGRLHPETPVTDFPDRQVETTFEGVWIATGMDIDKALDASDKDYLKIRPPEPVERTIRAVENAGFEFRKVTTDPDRIQVGDVRSELACDQEYVFRPLDDRHGANLEEIELHFVPDGDRTQVLIEFDRHRGEESFRSVTVGPDDSTEEIERALEAELGAGDRMMSGDRTVSVEGHLGETPVEEWELTTTDGGAAAVNGADSLDFRVYKCNRALAEATLGEAHGQMEVSFDWTFDPDEWWEPPRIAVKTPEGAESISSVGSGVDKERGQKTEGRFRGRTRVDGPVTLQIGLVPSDHCDNHDHENTHFSVRNLSVEFE